MRRPLLRPLLLRPPELARRSRRRLGRGAAVVALTGGLSAAMAALGGPVGAQASYLGGFSHLRSLGSTLPPGKGSPGDGDVNPYGIVVVPQSTGNLSAGSVLVSNFNDKANAQGTGRSIVEIAPGGTQTVFARLPGAPGGVGLSTALGVLPGGFVIVGSLPTKNGSSKTATRGALFILNANGQLVETLANQLIDGPWDLATVTNGTQATVFFTNVLNGTVKAKGKVVHGGTVVKMVLDDSGTAPKVLSSVVIGSGYPERTDPTSLVLGPTGVAVDTTGDVFVTDTVGSKIWEIPNALAMTSSLGEGTAIATSAQKLAGPLGLAIAPNGDLLAANGANGYVVELSPTGSAVDRVLFDKSVAAKGAVPGSGALFGLVAAPNGAGVYFVDDATNRLDLFGP